MTAYINEALCLAPIIAITKYHAGRFNRQLKTGKWFHILWGCVFTAAITFFWWITDKDYLFGCALVLEHFIFFNPLLNYFRKPRKPFFYTSNAGENPSWWDGALDKVYVPAWCIALAGFIILQFFL